MARSRLLLALIATVTIGLAACSDQGTAPPLTRGAALPAVTTPPTTAGPTSTTVSLPASEADKLTREELRTVVAAAGEAFAEHGTYDVPLETISTLAGGQAVVSLEDAAVKPGVVYEPVGERVTMHHLSSSGRWFCVDLTAGSADYGFGDSFSASLETCTDGLPADGWGDAFSPNGPDEAAIGAVFEALNSAVREGDSEAAHALFDSATACARTELLDLWPQGLPLADGMQLEGVIVSGSSATSQVAFDGEDPAVWRLVADGPRWLIAVDPCIELEQLTVPRVVEAARRQLEAGLFAVRSVFVSQTDFAISRSALEKIDPDVRWVETSSVGFGELFYRGSETAGVIVTRAAGTYLCAVESSTATTRYAEADDPTQIDSVSRCLARS